MGMRNQKSISRITFAAASTICIDEPESLHCKLLNLFLVMRNETFSFK